VMAHWNTVFLNETLDRDRRSPSGPGRGVHTRIALEAEDGAFRHASIIACDRRPSVVS
jgi:hypothetical protein